MHHHKSLQLACNKGSPGVPQSAVLPVHYLPPRKLAVECTKGGESKATDEAASTGPTTAPLDPRQLLLRQSLKNLLRRRQINQKLMNRLHERLLKLLHLLGVGRRNCYRLGCHYRLIYHYRTSYYYRFAYHGYQPIHSFHHRHYSLHTSHLYNGYCTITSVGAFIS